MAHLEFMCAYVRQYGKIMRDKEIKGRDLNDSELRVYEERAREILKHNSEGLVKEYCVHCFPRIHGEDNVEEDHERDENFDLQMFRAWVDKFSHTEFV